MEELKVVAVKKNDGGNLSKFKLSDGRIVNFDECAAMCDCGELNLIHTTGKDGAPVIRSYPDGDDSNNLSNLPEFY